MRLYIILLKPLVKMSANRGKCSNKKYKKRRGNGKNVNLSVNQVMAEIVFQFVHKIESNFVKVCFYDFDNIIRINNKDNSTKVTPRIPLSNVAAECK